MNKPRVFLKRKWWWVEMPNGMKTPISTSLRLCATQLALEAGELSYIRELDWRQYASAQSTS